MYSSTVIRKLAGKNIRWLRKVHDMGQHDLMEKIGVVSQPQMSQIENGSYRVNEEMLQKIAAVFNLPFYYLYAEHLPDLLNSLQNKKASSSKNFYADTKKTHAHLYNLEKKIDFVCAHKRHSLNERLRAYLSAQEHYFLYIHTPFLLTCGLHNRERIMRYISELPSSERVCLKLYLCNAPDIALTPREITSLARKSGRRKTDIQETIVSWQTRWTELDPDPLIQILTYNFESMLLALHQSSLAGDKQKNGYFLRKTKHYIRRLNKILKLAKPDDSEIAELCGLNPSDVATLRRSILHRMYRRSYPKPKSNPPR